MTDEAVLSEIGRRTAELRLSRNTGQSELAARAGIGVATLQRLESGRPVELTSLVRILRALGRLEDFGRALPEPLPSPLAQLKLDGNRRKRARQSRADRNRPQGPWEWADDGSAAN